MKQLADRRTDAGYQAYCWARFASDPAAGERARAEGRELSNHHPNGATEWQRWAAGVPAETDQQRAIDLALMWVKVAQVQPDGPADVRNGA
ncbi:hypothetical protein [Streptomyces niveus]|uniref:hypothetical protein n=1 Tax=Streptomyces niveus TaxID=193462 RepID=UPI00343026D4